jgi:hypothetical protein
VVRLARSAKEENPSALAAIENLKIVLGQIHHGLIVTVDRDYIEHHQRAGCFRMLFRTCAAREVEDTHCQQCSGDRS